MNPEDGPAPVSVSQAMMARQSVRAFLPTSVPDILVREILDMASRAPSGGNLQPWQIFAVTGEAMRDIGVTVSERMAQGTIQEDGALNAYPAGLWEPYRGRRHLAGTERYAAMGFFDKDPMGLKKLTDMNTEFFGAPVGLIFCVSERMQRHQWCDLGMYMQSVMLLAVERGLDTCPQAFWGNWHQVLRQILSIPDDLVVVTGMALGYRDSDHAINNYRTERAPLASFVHFSGF